LGWHLAYRFGGHPVLFALGIAFPSISLGLTIWVGGIVTQDLIEGLAPYFPRRVDVRRTTLGQKLLGTFRCQTYWLLATRGAQRVRVSRQDRGRARRPPLHLPAVRGAREPPRLGAARGRAAPSRPRRLHLSEHARDARGALRRARRRARARADQHAAQQRRDRLHPQALGREVRLRGPRAGRTRQAARPRGRARDPRG